MRSRTWFLLGLGILGLLLLARSHLAMGLLVKLLVDNLTVGDSFTKSYLFLLYLSATFFLWALVPNGSEKRWTPRFGPLLLLLYALQILEHFFFALRFHRSPYASTQAYHDFEFASTRLEHIHVSKAILGQWLSGVNYQFDAGVPFVPYFPRPLLLVHFSLFVVCVALVPLILLEIRSRYPASEQIVLVLIIFVLVENTVDGGILNPQCAVAGLVYLNLVHHVSLRWSLSLGSAALILLLWPALTPTGQIIYQILCFFALLGYSQEAVKCRDSISRLLALSLLFVVGLVVAPVIRNQLLPSMSRTGHAFNVARYGATRLEKGQVVLLVSQGELPESGSWRLIDRRIAGPYQQSEVEILSPTSILGLCQQSGLHLQRFPVDPSTPYRRTLNIVMLDPKRPNRRWEIRKVDVPPGSQINFAASHLGKHDLILGPMRLSTP